MSPTIYIEELTDKEIEKQIFDNLGFSIDILRGRTKRDILAKIESTNGLRAVLEQIYNQKYDDEAHISKCWIEVFEILDKYDMIPKSVAKK